VPERPRVELKYEGPYRRARTEIEYTWKFKQGSGSFSIPTQGTVDNSVTYIADRAATVTGVIPKEAGTNIIELTGKLVETGEELEGSPVTFTIHVLDKKVLPQTETKIQAKPKEEKRLEVLVVDTEGNAIPNQVITWEVVEGGGKLNATNNTLEAETNEMGLASVTWTLGPAIGTQKVTASALDEDGQHLVDSPVEFTADTQFKYRLEINSATDDQEAEPEEYLPDPLLVEVKDQDGEAVPNLEVHWKVLDGGGVLDQQVSYTDESGVATNQWKLGEAEGYQNVEVSIDTIGKKVENSPTQFKAKNPCKPEDTKELEFFHGTWRISGAPSGLSGAPFRLVIFSNSGAYMLDREGKRVFSALPVGQGWGLSGDCNEKFSYTLSNPNGSHTWVRIEGIVHSDGSIHGIWYSFEDSDDAETLQVTLTKQ